MSSALDAFRAQREAAEQVHAQLMEVSRLLEQLCRQADAIARDADLRAVLRDEQNWLREARQFVAEVRYLREQDRVGYWPGVWRRWVVAVLFALASAAAFGAASGRFAGFIPGAQLDGPSITNDVILQNHDRPRAPRR
jgi:hypothetical protein